MAESVLMPQAGQSMTEGKIVQWFVKEGDKVRQGDPILEIETDKANMDVEATADGVVRKIAYAEGDVVPVLVPVAVIGTEDEAIDFDSLFASNSSTESSSTNGTQEAAPASAPATDPGKADLVLMPQAGQSMTEGKIVQWFVKEGDKVRPGDPILEIETDKANMDVESPAEGVVRKVAYGEGDVVPVLVPVAIIADENESLDIDALLSSNGSTSVAPSAPAPAPVSSAPAPTKSVPASVKAAPVATLPKTNGRQRVSPLARRIAEARGIDLSGLTGSGPRGRILRRDVEAATEQLKSAPSAAPAVSPQAMPQMPVAMPMALPGAQAEYPAPKPRPEAVIPITGMRKAIAQGLQYSKQNAPHFYVSMEVDVTACEAQRQAMKARGDKVSLNDFVVYATAIALNDEPKVNCRVFDDRVEYPTEVNIGIAVGLDEGLVVPVLQRASEKNLRGISEENRRIIASAREGKLVGSGKGTFTISNLGMFGVESFSAVINPPEGAILAVGAAQPRLVPMGGGFFPRTILKLTLSADHRAVDGVLAAQFLARMRYLLEHPERLA